ncbi:MAG TPA: iron ABC transporter substrate-binding protein [Acidimicrobiales bacterium]|nr:iron ABC transporter substrate-binding protein [Acidimicrobiales bacterium]
MRNSQLGRLMAVACVVLVGSTLAACGSSASGSTTLTLYNGQHEQTTNELVAAFEKQTGITVKVRNGDEDVLGNQILQEGSGSPADLFYAENSPVLEKLQENGALAPVDPSTLNRVPSKFNSPKGDWVGVSARVNVVVYNTNQLKSDQVPTSIMDLANPKWKGKLALAQGETDFQPIVTSIVTTYGKQAALTWLKAIKANAGNNIYPNNESLVDQINKGRAEIGIINSYYWYRLQDQVGSAGMHSAISYFAPGDAGYVVDVSGAAVLNSSKNKAAAQKFLAFMVSSKGQEIIAHDDSWEYPLGSGVTTARQQKPFSQLQPAPLTIAQLGDGATAVALLQEVQLA